MKLYKLTGLVAGFTVAAGLVATTVAGPTAPADNVTALVQDNAKSKGVAISGTVIGSDGEPAAKLPVTLMAFQPPKTTDRGSGPGGPKLSTFEPTSNFKAIAKTVTDANGKFTFKNVRNEIPALRLEIGNKMKSDWAIKAVNISDGKNKDLGEVKLQASLRSKR